MASSEDAEDAIGASKESETSSARRQHHAYNSWIIHSPRQAANQFAIKRQTSRFVRLLSSAWETVLLNKTNTALYAINVASIQPLQH
jgi:hypothetical protein